MTKKRNCRYTEDEARIHAEAVRIRKMTDAQIAEFVERVRDSARKDGITEGMSLAREGRKPVDVDAIMDSIAAVKGIGEVKLHYIREILEKECG